MDPTERQVYDHLAQRGFERIEFEPDGQRPPDFLVDSRIAVEARYRSGRQFRYVGGHFERFPARISPPHAGSWTVVLDLGGGSATIRHSIRVIGHG